MRLERGDDRWNQFLNAHCLRRHWKCRIMEGCLFGEHIFDIQISLSVKLVIFNNWPFCWNLLKILVGGRGSSLSLTGTDGRGNWLILWKGGVNNQLQPACLPINQFWLQKLQTTSSQVTTMDSHLLLVFPCK
jgi:hypothetical protein